MARIAFMTVGVLHELYEDPKMRGFMDRIDENFNNAKFCEGFISRSYQDPNLWGEYQLPSIFPPETYDRTPATFSLWRDLESVFAFSYAGSHGEALSKRKEWFVKPEWPSYVAWWVDEDHTPTFREASERYEHYLKHGSTALVFDFKQPFDAEGNPTKVDRELVKQKVDRNTKTIENHAKGLLPDYDAATLVQTYLNAWNSAQRTQRLNLIQEAWHKDGMYTDPISNAKGQDGLGALIQSFHEQNPGARFSLEGAIEHHHQFIRFNWALTFADGTTVRGMDFGEISEDGKLIRIVGFF